MNIRRHGDNGENVILRRHEVYLSLNEISELIYF